MRISTVKLINFKSYRNQVFTFPPPRGNKNLVLIGGLNGFGKTSFLDRFPNRACLYFFSKHKSMDLKPCFTWLGQD